MIPVIGLTGGVGSGKSTVARLFQQYHVPVIDTDALAREAVEPGSPALAAILQRFGPQLLSPDGTLDRAALRHIIFTHTEHRAWLEQLLHPLIRQALWQRIRSLREPYCIAVIPLLVENYPHPLVQRVLVVDTPESIQIQRTMARDNCSAAAAQQIMHNQASRDARLRCAHDVITNDKDLPHLEKQVKQLHTVYSKAYSGS